MFALNISYFNQALVYTEEYRLSAFSGPVESGILEAQIKSHGASNRKQID